jgi:GTP-binding protein
MMYDWIVSGGVCPIIIATKLDKLKRSQVSRHVKLIREELKMPKEGKVFTFSALSKQGRDEIWEEMESIISTEISRVFNKGEYSDEECPD